jgi:hypothetical protein
MRLVDRSFCLAFACFAFAKCAVRRHASDN